jgi:hypothetical protein
LFSLAAATQSPAGAIVASALASKTNPWKGNELTGYEREDKKELRAYEPETNRCSGKEYRHATPILIARTTREETPRGDEGRRSDL